MNKYINADNLKQQMIKYGWKHPDSTVHEFVDDMPAADVRENIHGEWIEGDELLFCGETCTTGDKCSVCGRTAMGYPWHFCPNCGADMRGKAE